MSLLLLKVISLTERAFSARRLNEIQAVARLVSTHRSVYRSFRVNNFLACAHPPKVGSAARIVDVVSEGLGDVRRVLTKVYVGPSGHVR